MRVNVYHEELSYALEADLAAMRGALERAARDLHEAARLLEETPRRDMAQFVDGSSDRARAALASSPGAALIQCERCRGSGQVTAETLKYHSFLPCSDCGGTGRVPGAAWRAMAREVVEALERATKGRPVYGNPWCKVCSSLWGHHKTDCYVGALLARPEVQRWAGR